MNESMQHVSCSANNDNAYVFQDKKHVYLYCHPAFHKQKKNNFSDDDDKSCKWYDYIPNASIVIQSKFNHVNLGHGYVE